MKDISPQPELATKWTPSADGLTWTLDIREGVTWSDGQPLTAKDVAYTLNRIIDGGAEAVNYGTYLKGVTSATATDDTHVVLKLSKPIASLPLLPIPIVPEHIWKNVSEDDVKSYAAEPEDGQPVVGSGPFELVEGTAGGSTYRFERNPHYWGPTPSCPAIVCCGGRMDFHGAPLNRTWVKLGATAKKGDTAVSLAEPVMNSSPLSAAAATLSGSSAGRAASSSARFGAKIVTISPSSVREPT